MIIVQKDMPLAVIDDKDDKKIHMILLKLLYLHVIYIYFF